jgi:quercetin dioxygenase-like cupin family protein
MKPLVRWLPGAAVSLLAGQVWGQAQPGSLPTRIDAEQVRVILATEQPHRRGAMHEHANNRVQIYLNDGVTTLTRPDGKVDRVEYKVGDVRWSPAGGQHISENITDHPVRIVEIDLKNKPQARKASDLDPLKLDPKHYKLEFENDQVRVLRVRFGPNEKGVLHEHTMNHVVVYLNDQRKGKAGEFRLDPPETHTEENPLDHAVERIAIDIK